MMFKVNGGFITDHARNLVIEDRWEDALHILKDCVVESSYEIAVLILNGEKRFEGVNNVKLVDEDPLTREKLCEDLTHHFCGVYKEGADYWRPYAYVDSWFAGDLGRSAMTTNIYNNYDGPAPPKPSSRYETWAMARNTFYMMNAQEDLATMAEVNGYPVIVLWTKIRVSPPWLAIRRNRQQAVDDFVRYRWLEHRGGHMFVTSKHKEKVEVSDEQLAARERFEQEQEDKYQRDYDKIVGKIDINSLDTQNGWLSPTGQLIPCQYMEHDFFALVILSERYKAKSETVITRGDVLIKRGWVKLQLNEWVADQVTQDQYDIIWDYTQKHGLKMPSQLEVE